jgi:hypothetical protein
VEEPAAVIKADIMILAFHNVNGWHPSFASLQFYFFYHEIHETHEIVYRRDRKER